MRVTRRLPHTIVDRTDWSKEQVFTLSVGNHSIEKFPVLACQIANEHASSNHMAIRRNWRTANDEPFRCYKQKDQCPGFYARPHVLFSQKHLCVRFREVCGKKTAKRPVHDAV